MGEASEDAREASTGWPVVLAALVMLPVLTGCPRTSLDAGCPDLSEGELVVTELRGSQSGVDSLGEWIELLNTRDSEAELVGLRIEMVPLDGREPVQILVRNEALTVAAGDYVVIGLQDDNNLPDYVDYGYRLTKDTKGLFGSAVIEVSSCDTIIDEVIYRDLPELGTLALDGDVKASAIANDDEDAFCVDADEAPVGPNTDFGLPGTPGEANKPCATE